MNSGLFRRALVVAVIAVSLLPSIASAHGPLRRGLEVDHNVTLASSTSNCSCDRRWYTVGLQPGPFTVTLKMKSCYGPAGPTCGMFAHLYRNAQHLQTAQTACYTSKAGCTNSLRIQYRVPTAGVYYVLVEGTGALAIRYTVSLRGNIYPLHCRKYC